MAKYTVGCVTLYNIKTVSPDVKRLKVIVKKKLRFKFKTQKD